MTEHQKKSQPKDEQSDSQKLARHTKPEQYSGQSHAWDQQPSGVRETPFLPKTGEHSHIVSSAGSSAERAAIVMRLQQTYGNRYVQRLLQSKKIQAKLSVSSPGDAYEREADKVAEQVTRKIDSPDFQRQEEEEELQMKEAFGLQRQEEEEEEEMLQPESAVQRQEEEEELQMKEVPGLQRQEEEELQMEEAPGLQRQEEEEEEEMLQPESAVQRQEEEEELQMKRTSGQTPEVSGELESSINSARGGGQPIADETRGPLEKAFNNDFSGVRIHTDTGADGLSKSIQARAFTTGTDIFFRSGEYDPGSSSGKQLLAHELTHVVQQSEGRLNTHTNGRAASGINRSSLSNSATTIIQRADDYLDSTIWKDKSKLDGVTRSWKLRAIDGAVKAYQKVKDADVDTRIAALEKITGAIQKWKSSNGKGEKYKQSARWSSVKELESQASEAWRLAHLEKKQAAEAAATKESIDEILNDVDRNTEDKAALAATAFQRFNDWCKAKNIKYTTHGASSVDLLVAKSGKYYCEGLALALVKVFQACHIADAEVYPLPQEWFTTKPLPNFVDQTTSGNLKTAGSAYGAAGRRFFFNKHWVTKANGGTIYDPTSGEKEAAAEAKIDESGFSKETRTIEDKEEEVYVKGSTWIRALPGEVDCSAFGYELHNG